MFDSIVQTVNSKAKEKDTKPFIIAISGFGGSGKSFLAKKLSAVLHNSQLISIDDFVTNRLSARSEDWKDFDRTRFLNEVLIPARTGHAINYGVYDWKSNTIAEHKKIPETPFLIVEGCSIFHPDLMHSYDYSIWIDVSLEHATQQGRKRDHQQGCNSSWDNNWHNIWMPNEQDFLQKYRPMDKADVKYCPELPR